jgi:hypothetical protein
MGEFSIELLRRGGKTTNKILRLRNKPAIGEWLECSVGGKIIEARVIAIRHHPSIGLETIVAQEVESGRAL